MKKDELCSNICEPAVEHNVPKKIFTRKKQKPNDDIEVIKEPSLRTDSQMIIQDYVYPSDIEMQEPDICSPVDSDSDTIVCNVAESTSSIKNGPKEESILDDDFIQLNNLLKEKLKTIEAELSTQKAVNDKQNNIIEKQVILAYKQKHEAYKQINLSENQEEKLNINENFKKIYYNCDEMQELLIKNKNDLQELQNIASHSDERNMQTNEMISHVEDLKRHILNLEEKINVIMNENDHLHTQNKGISDELVSAKRKYKEYAKKYEELKKSVKSGKNGEEICPRKSHKKYKRSDKHSENDKDDARARNKKTCPEDTNESSMFKARKLTRTSSCVEAQNDTSGAQSKNKKQRYSDSIEISKDGNANKNATRPTIHCSNKSSNISNILSDWSEDCAIVGQMDKNYVNSTLYTVNNSIPKFGTIQQSDDTMKELTECGLMSNTKYTDNEKDSQNSKLEIKTEEIKEEVQDFGYCWNANSEIDYTL